MLWLINISSLNTINFGHVCGMCTYVSGDPRLTPGVFPLLFFIFILWDRVSRWTWSSPIWWDRVFLISFKAPPLLPCAEVIGTCCYTQHFLKDLFIYSCVWVLCLHVWLYARRGHQIPLWMVMSHHVGAGNWTQDPWKSSQCSWLLSYSLPPPLPLSFETGFHCVALASLELTL